MTNETKSLNELNNHSEFTQRHVGSSADEQQQMLDALKLASLDQLIEKTVPGSIRLDDALDMDQGVSETAALSELRALADQNKVNKSYIGMGYYNTKVPFVILRNVLENPGWYTAYTPYQPEIAQGRLEALLNYQQMVMDITGMALANASLLDEATAAAEAMTLCKRANRKKSNTYFVSTDVHPQTIDVIKTRAQYFGYDIVVDSADKLADYDVFGAQLQYPATDGTVTDLEAHIKVAQEQKAMVAVASDLLALMLLKSPGEMGADIVLGTSQRFGVPMGFGGPHAAFFAASDKLKRQVPGRIIGVSIDSEGNPALRMAMQTREQHIRREKATSNICTAQALLANMASFYAVYHGPDGLKRIAERTHRLTAILANGLASKGVSVNSSYFDTITIAGDAALYQRALDAGCNLRQVSADQYGISLDETTGLTDVAQLFDIILGADHGLDAQAIDDQIVAGQVASGISTQMRRTDAVLTHPTFNSYQSETEMLRYLKRLENKDYSLAHGMIPLGSCTMKLNATAQMIPVTWNEFGNVHPFAPLAQTQGYQTMITQLEAMLVEVTGYDNVSLQPNSGAQGEYAGLLAIRQYQEAQGEGHRNICLIPSSAHGTNPASAAMMSLKVVIVECDEKGNVDVSDLKAKALEHAENLSCIMITYPSTHGIYEEEIVEICEVIHECGGQVYMDGANMNAQVGISKPGLIGSDVSHLNLHKTFAIPHGGGGPGVGPIGVKSHLAPYLPGHKVMQGGAVSAENGAVSATPFGSAGILPITWMYIRMLGKNGLKHSTQNAILGANYMTEKLADHYQILYRGRNDKVAHECIVDIRPLKEASGISEEDIAKRLMDYGLHAPTMSFPVAGTLMIEPTESESKAEIDRLIEAMVKIRAEIAKVESGEWPLDNNPLVNAPHTQQNMMSDWDHPYTREQAFFPSAASKAAKFWPSVNRVDNVFGDRNFICSCPSIDVYRD
jgi:glycine dehydrogenase